MNRYKQHSIIFIKHITIALIIALGAITFVSCSTDEVNTIIEEPIENVAVQFTTNIEKEVQTRATTLDDAALKSQGFGILAHYTQNSPWSVVATRGAPNFMYNEKIEWNTPNTSWNYSPVKYWPNNSGHKVTFFAYAPYEANPTTGATKGIKLPANTAEGTPSINFSINGSITNQVDLVYASAKDKNKEVVDFQFKHALSRIGFSAKAADDYGDTVIKMTSVSLKGKFYQSGKLNLLDGAWSEYETPAADVRYEHLFEPAKELDTVVELIHGEDGYMMIIPQNFEGSNIFTLEATYTIDEELQPKITEEINLNFEKGKAYNITLNISVDPDESATSVTVLPWVDVNAKREYSDFEISTTANWSNPNLEVSYEMGETIIFNFTMLHPVGRVWKATITNGLDFALDETFAVSGSSGGNPQVGVKALKPATTVDRTTEFYLTVDGKEVDTNGDGTIGKGHRYVITQKAIE